MVRLGTDSLLVQRRLQCRHLGVRRINPRDRLVIQRRDWDSSDRVLDNICSD